MRCPRFAAAFCVATLLLAASPARAAIFDYAVGDTVGRSLRLNVPDDLTFVRGILIWGNGANGDNRGRALNDELVTFAHSLGFCVLATAYWANFTDPNELTTFETGIRQLAAQSGRPELVDAPWLPIGHSNGGQMSYGFNALRPERCIATVTSKGAYYNNTRPGPAVLRTPGLMVAGEVDNLLGRTNIRDLFTGNRPRGALWAWVEEEGSGHPENDSPEIIRPFIAECVRLRLPVDADPRNGPVTLRDVPETSGWLVEPESYKAGFARIYPYADYPGDRSTAGWLPTERVAMIFRAFASYQKAAAATLEGVTGAVAEWGTRVTYRVATPSGDWTTLQLFEGATLLATLTPTTADLSWTQNVTTPGYLSFHALVMYRDGTQRTTMPRRVFVKAAPDMPPSLEPPVVQAQSTAGAKLATLSWTTCAGATSYRVERATSGSGPWTAVAEVTEASFAEFAQLPGCRSWYRVVSRSGAGDLALSNAVPVDAAVVQGSAAGVTNLSARATVADGRTVIAGLGVSGSQPVTVLLRAAGPALRAYGVTDPLGDPVIMLHKDDRPLFSNRGWESAPNAEQARVAASQTGAFGFAAGSTDSALLVTLAPGTYTLVVSSASGATGTVLAETYAVR